MMQESLECIEDTIVMKAVRTPCIEDLIDRIVPAILIFLSTVLLNWCRKFGFLVNIFSSLNKLIAILSPTRACYKLWVTQLP